MDILVEKVWCLFTSKYMYMYTGVIFTYIQTLYISLIKYEKSSHFRLLTLKKHRNIWTTKNTVSLINICIGFVFIYHSKLAIAKNHFSTDVHMFSSRILLHQYILVGLAKHFFLLIWLKVDWQLSTLNGLLLNLRLYCPC